jgi:hypothetical protein
VYWITFIAWACLLRVDEAANNQRLGRVGRFMSCPPVDFQSQQLRSEWFSVNSFVNPGRRTEWGAVVIVERGLTITGIYGEMAPFCPTRPPVAASANLYCP